MTNGTPKLSVELYNDEDLLFKNVRIAWPSFFKPAVNKDGKVTGFEALLLVPKSDTESCRYIKWYIKTVAEGNGIELKTYATTCIRDADQEGKDSDYEKGCLLIRVRSKNYPPRVFDSEMVEQTEERNGVAYNGSYCDVLSRGWARTKIRETGKPYVGLGVLAVRHAADGERIGTGITDDSIAGAFGAPLKKPDLKSAFPATERKQGPKGPARKAGSQDLGEFDDLVDEEPTASGGGDFGDVDSDSIPF